MGRCTEFRRLFSSQIQLIFAVLLSHLSFVLVCFFLIENSIKMSFFSPKNPKNLDSHLIEANTKFGFKLFSEILRQDEGKNIFISPTSVAIALTLLYNGASGKTQQEMATVLELQGIKRSDINAANQTLLATLENLDPEVLLSIANSVWIRQNFPLNQQFLQQVKQFYQATATELDFNSPKATEIINQWVRENTRGKIPQIIESIDPADVLFLINAIYFKGNWSEKFARSRTTQKPFYLPDGSNKQHPLMSQSGEYFYYENKLFQVVRLPYGSKQVSMYVFLPRKNSNLDIFYQQLTPDNWKNWMKRLSKREGYIELPRFKLEYEITLNDILKALGMASIFDSSADFAAMTSHAVCVSEVKHKTFVEVNEEGTEAAAATSIAVTRSAVIFTPPFRMIVDRPFFYTIRDDRTGLILFMGSIVAP